MRQRAGRQPLPLHGLPGHRRGRLRARRGARRHERRRARTRVAAPQVGRSMQRLDGREKLRGEAEFVGDMTVPRMLHGKVLRSPVPHARIVSIDTSRGRGHARRRLRADGRATWLTSIPTGATRSGTGRSSPSTGCASTASRSPPSRPTTRPTAERALLADRRRVRGAARSRARVDEALAPGRAAGATTGPLRPGLFHGLGELPPRDGNVCYRYRHRPRRGRGRVRARRHRGRGRVHLPRRLPVRDGDPHGRSPRSSGTRSRCGRPASTRSSCAPRSRRCSSVPLSARCA